VAGVERRLAEAEAALTTLEEAVGTEPRSLLQRDSAILRLIYTFEAVWKACQQLLAEIEEIEEIEVASPNTTIRAARRLGWLSDEDAAGAMKIGRDRNLAVQMYRGTIGAEIAERLAGHAALLRRWLEALQKRAGEK
jgi:Nucleotidyltransferase substrate binding protein like